MLTIRQTACTQPKVNGEAQCLGDSGVRGFSPVVQHDDITEGRTAGDHRPAAPASVQTPQPREVLVPSWAEGRPLPPRRGPPAPARLAANTLAATLMLQQPAHFQAPDAAPAAVHLSVIGGLQLHQARSHE